MRPRPSLIPLSSTPPRRAARFCLALFACVFASPVVGQTRSAAVRFDGEAVVGISINDSLRVFRGVPFAAPPTGSRRWKAPERHVAERGTRRADRFGPACPQSPTGLGPFYRGIAAGFGRADSVNLKQPRTSEDCLTLNIWSTGKAGSTAPLPVMVWVHGGSNVFGEGASSLYDGSKLARRGVVTVTINYRLGALGFLAHPALSAESPVHASGNYALLDQIAALQWVQRNIAQVGGDPSRVTLFGESAGSIDILHLMASPLAAGLFHRAIAQSGAPMAPLPTLTQAERTGVVVAAALGIDSTQNILAALRSAPVDSIVAVSTRLLSANPNLSSAVVDGQVLRESTGRAFDQGRVARVPLLLGSNALEMSSLRTYVPGFDRTVANYSAWLSRTFSLLAPRLLALYPVRSDSDVEPTLLQVTTHLYMTCPTRFAARGTSRAGVPTYLYQFTRVLPGGEALGAYHSAEIGYVFGTKESWLPLEPVDATLSDAMATYWVQFATKGDPNAPSLPAWPVYEQTSDRHLELGRVIAPSEGLTRDACDLVQTALRAQLR